MHKKFLSWLSLCGLLVAFVAQSSAQAPAAAAGSVQLNIGQIKATRVVGKVSFEDIATKTVQPLANDQIIHQGTIVKTDVDSSVVLVFGNGASINLAHTSELNIDTFLQHPFSDPTFEPGKALEEPSVSITNITLKRGELVGNVKRLRSGQGSKFTVGTPVGAAGIRGTTFRIVYRPTGNGQAFNFSIMTVEGNVEVELASGTVTLPGVAVTANQEIVINEVTVDPATNTLTVTTAGGQQAAVTVAPPVELAPVTTAQQVQAKAAELVIAVAAVVFTPPPAGPPPAGSGSGTSGTQTQNPPDQNQQNQNQQNQNQQNQNQQDQSQQNQGNSPGSTTNTPRITN